jgi:Putative MetA-pathway of phenol degradation
VHSLDSIINSSFSLSYGATENLSINVRLPYIQRKNISESELEDGAPEAHTHGDSAGLGDLVVLGQYSRMQTDTNFDVSLLFGLKAPTGETETKDDDSVRFETEFQPGSGSWDFLLGAAASKSSGNVGYHANVLYTMTTEGAQSTEIGDAIAYNAALTYRLNDFHFMHDHTHHAASNTNELKWDLSLELNGDTRRKNSVVGVSEEHSGGTAIYASPGFKVSYKTFSGFISFGIPVTDNSNGTQTDVDSRIVTGLSVVL